MTNNCASFHLRFQQNISKLFENDFLQNVFFLFMSLYWQIQLLNTVISKRDLMKSPVMLGILPSMPLTFATNWLYTALLRTSLPATSPSFLRSAGAGFSFSTSHLFLLDSKLSKILGTVLALRHLNCLHFILT